MAYIKLAEFEGSDSALNFKKLLMLRPKVSAAWDELLSAIKETQEFRTYELATLAAAKNLKSSYCVLAHGSALAQREMSLEDVADIVASGSSGNLSEKDQAVLEFAGKVPESPGQMTQSDIDELRSLSFSDAEIFDIAATAAARSFLTRLMDSLGIQPDSHYSSLPEAIKGKLVVGRPIEQKLQSISTGLSALLTNGLAVMLPVRFVRNPGPYLYHVHGLCLIAGQMRVNVRNAQ